MSHRGGSPRGVLITRPEPAATQTAHRIEVLGWHPIVAPMLELRPRRARLPSAEAVQAVLLTSAAAISALPARLHGVLILAVGDTTAAVARRAGFASVVSAGADAAALARLAADRCDPKGLPLLLAAASGQGERLAADLRARGFRVLRRSVYDARPADALPPAAVAALTGGDIAAVLFFSPATARAFVRALDRDSFREAVARVDAYAISSATEEALISLPWRRVFVASHPNQDELLALLQ